MRTATTPRTSRPVTTVTTRSHAYGERENRGGVVRDRYGLTGSGGDSGDVVTARSPAAARHMAPEWPRQEMSYPSPPPLPRLVSGTSGALANVAASRTRSGRSISLRVRAEARGAAPSCAMGQQGGDSSRAKRAENHWKPSASDGSENRRRCDMRAER